MKYWVMVLVAIAGLNSEEAGACKAHRAQKTPLAPVGAAFSSESIYNSSGRWRSPSGAGAKLGDFRGQNVIITMAFTHCTFTCPLIIAKLKEIEKQLIASGVTDYRFVVASFDPVRDTPERLAAYMKEKNLSDSHWTMLSPRSDRDVRELAAVLGVTYSKEKQGDYSHSNIVSVLDREGVIVDKVNGIAADHESLVASVTGKN